MEYLSNIELYYTRPDNFTGGEVILQGEDFYHAAKVMRHKDGDMIFITNGEGKIARCRIIDAGKDKFILTVDEQYAYTDNLKNIIFCIPRLKSSDRFEFALEKCVELGITHFIIYEADRAVAKGNKSDRWQKITLAAMKQSLRSFLPKIEITGNLSEIADRHGKKFVFEQNCSANFNPLKINKSDVSYFIFGPEGGLDEKEIDLFKSEEIYKLSDIRLRSETAVIVCASRL